MFRVTIRLGSPDETRWREVSAIVDTGATLTKIPRSVAEALGLLPRRKVKVVLGNRMEVWRDVARAIVEYGGVADVVPVAIGENGEDPILGVTALEILGFAVDPVNETLTPAVHYELAALSR